MGRLPIFYINLESRLDRRDFMERQFDRLGLSADRVVALTPAQLPSDRVVRFSDPNKYRWMTTTELACSSSHGLALRAALNSGASLSLILEDDVVLSPELPHFLDSLAVTSPFDVLRIETNLGPIRISPQRIPLVDGFEGRVATGWCNGSAGYVVNRHAAELLLQGVALFEMPIDEVLFNPYRRIAKKLRIVHCEPALCYQLASDAMDCPH